MMRMCWYCAYAFRDDPSTVTCTKTYSLKGRTHCCPYFVECTKKKYASDEQLKI